MFVDRLIDAQFVTCKEITKLKKQVLEYLWNQKPWPCNLTTIYNVLGCADIPLYIALDELVKEGTIDGHSPYVDFSDSFDNYYYRV